MRAAILCPGPTLPLTWHDHEQAQLIIAINAAASLEVPDWLVGTHREPQYKFLSGYYCGTSDATEGERLGPCAFTEEERCLAGTQTVPGALFLARHLGARVARLYGCDHAGDERFDGTKTNAKRWENERVLLRHAVKLCKKNGMRVEKVQVL